MKKAELEMRRRLSEELNKLGWTNAEIADELRCSKAIVTLWRQGERFPGPVYLRDLYEIGCDIMYILTGEATRA